MLYFMKEKMQCTGCSACYNLCPTKCITMEKDEEGFLYPIASDRCVHCGKCETVCSAVNKKNDGGNTLPEAYCALTKDNKVWKQSASGGAFTEICKAWNIGDSVFCGATWNGLNIEHKCVQGIDNIGLLRRSKYVASDIKNVFREVKDYLMAGKRVVFCGTPCQVAGLKLFLGKEQENLLLIDLICHGVGSPKVFQVCVNTISNQFGWQVCSYEFRAKRNAYQTDHLQKIKNKNGKVIYIENDPYMQLFLSQQCLRPSCGKNCRFRSAQRQGDITIADFKGLTNVFPDLNGSRKNYSSIIFNTPKGKSVIPQLSQSMKMRKCDIDDIKKYNPLFYRHTWSSEKRDLFFQEFVASPEQTVEKWCKPARISKESLPRIIWRYLPSKLRKGILKLRAKVSTK